MIQWPEHGIGVKRGDRTERNDIERVSPGNLQSARPEPFDEQYRTVLSRTLSALQTLFMVLNLVFGVGYFQNITYAINVAGVGGATLALCLVGVVACCMTDCILEMLTLYPISNAKVEFVSAFVDEELAYVIGVAYWLAYAMFFSAFIASAVNIIANMTNLSEGARTGMTIGIFGLLAAANFARVRLFGYIELVMGAAKLGLITAVFVLMAYVDSTRDAPNGSTNNFGSDGKSTHSDAQAIFVATSLSTYPFIGLEAIATMSFETLKPAKGLRKTKYVSYSILAVYIILTIAMGFRFPRATPSPAVYDYQGMGGIVPLSHWPGDQTYSVSATTVQLSRVGLESKVLNGFYVFSAISAGNTALYVASRTLFGIVRKATLHQKVSVQALVGGLSHVTSSTRVPERAILASGLCFLWVAILVSQSSGGQLFYVAQTLVSMAISACVFIWASQCVAYLRHHHWQKKFSRTSTRAQPAVRTREFLLLSSIQPLPAWLGLIGCLCLIFVFDGATLWSTKTDFTARFCGAYLSPILMGAAWLILKAIRFATTSPHSFRWAIRMNNRASFRATISSLKSGIYPADYPVRVQSTPSRDRSIEFEPGERGDEAIEIVLVEPSTRTCTDSSEGTNDPKPEISRISDAETIERKPALAFPQYRSPRNTGDDLATPQNTPNNTTNELIPRQEHRHEIHRHEKSFPV